MKPLINVINPFNNANLAWRTSTLFQHLLAQKKFKLLPSKPPANFAYLTLMCRRDLLMTQLSLLSLARVCTKLPSLIVAHDESLVAQEVREALSFWPQPIKCLDCPTVASYHQVKGLEQLAIFCKRHIFGFKLAACLYAVNTGQLLYADADVLWFKDPEPLVTSHTDKVVWGAEDCHPSYDPDLLRYLPEDQVQLLSKKPFVNAGFALYNQLFLNAIQLQTYTEVILKNDPIHEFSEQTLVAIHAKTEGGILTSEEVCVSCEYTTNIYPSFSGKNWFARHYIRPVRQQFWIDAAGMFLFA
jgi:hypothetical protein